MLYVNDDITVFDLEAALAGLPECRREKALRFRTDLLRRQSVAAWILLRDAPNGFYSGGQTVFPVAARHSV